MLSCASRAAMSPPPGAGAASSLATRSPARVSAMPSTAGLLTTGAMAPHTAAHAASSRKQSANPLPDSGFRPRQRRAVQPLEGVAGEDRVREHDALRLAVGARGVQDQGLPLRAEERHGGLGGAEVAPLAAAAREVEELHGVSAARHGIRLDGSVWPTKEGVRWSQGIGNLPTAESGHARSFFINPRLFKALFGLL